MKKIKLMLLCTVCFLCGCNMEDTPEPSKYREYICYDYHLVCLNAYEQKAQSNVFYNDLEYVVQYRKPVGISDEQFICVWVKQTHPLALPELVLMQPAEKHIDVFSDWTIKKIEIYYVDLKKSIPIYEEDEPARTPAGILSTSNDPVILSEFVEFVTNASYSDKFVVQKNISREKLNEDDTYKLYIRVHFNEAENIVWDSTIHCYITAQTTERYIVIDKGRNPSELSSSNPISVSIDDFPALSTWITTTINQLITQ